MWKTIPTGLVLLGEYVVDIQNENLLETLEPLVSSNNVLKEYRELLDLQDL